MPAAFLGHGNPMNALEVNRYTTAWKAFGAAVPRPRAILVISAHWYIKRHRRHRDAAAADHP
jgi:4,5-DOPA dioxygenase extradiol